MQRSKRTELINKLKQEGYKMVTGYSYLYIHPTGKVYNLKIDKYLKRNARNYIKADNECLSVPKLALQAFANQPYKNGQISYKDGNRDNIGIENITYRRIFEPTRTPDPVSLEKLLTAIRCYFSVKERYKVNDRLQTRLYLQSITRQRLFFIEKHDLKHIEVFETFINGENTTQTATKHGLSTMDCSVIINQFTNILVKSILTDLEKGLLSIQPYKPKPPTITQTIREHNKWLIERGKKPLPLRKKSLKETLRDFKKTIDEFKNPHNS